MTHDDGYLRERVAAIYDETYADLFNPEIVGPTVAFLTELAGGGRVVGWGRRTDRRRRAASERTQMPT